MTLGRLRAPQGDGEILAQPPLSAASELIARNRAHFASNTVTIDGISLSDLRQNAIIDVARAAIAYLGRTPESIPSSLLVAGHQPELFHPGVWLKNFALRGLARATGAAPLNLIVDNDTAKAATLRVPVWDSDPNNVRFAAVPFDHLAGEVPYEERAVIDEGLFANFPERIAELTEDWPFEPLLKSLWPDVLKAPGGLLGDRFACARRALERRWGCKNLELPLSRLCTTDSFLHFARALMTDLPRFRLAYNDSVRAYRRRYGIRSRNHPVPDLSNDGDWYESPFWVWRSDAPRRRRLFVRSRGDQLELRAGDEAWGSLPIQGELAAWRELESTGRKIRTRALTTTLFARLALADLFVHGIGGGKYDELNDAIMRSFFGIEPPEFLVLSGTLRLPLPRFPVGIAQLHNDQRHSRDLYWNPQRYLGDDKLADPKIRAALAERQSWQDLSPDARPLKRQRYIRIRELSEQLRQPLATELARAASKQEFVANEFAANEVLGRRDFSFCLFPEATIRPFCTQVL